jgi:hypothetical protein
MREKTQFPERMPTLNQEKDARLHFEEVQCVTKAGAWNLY